MEQVLRRIDRLETHVDSLKDSVHELRVDLTELKTEFKASQPHLVTKTWLATAVILIVLSQIVIPIIRDFIHLNKQEDSQVITKANQ
jgi:hypothetical protein